MALQFNLLNNSGTSSAAPGDGSASVAVQNYNNGAVTGQTGILDQPLTACIASMLTDSSFPKVPNSTNPIGDNQAALAAVAAIFPPQVPVPFLMQTLSQESGQLHFHAPSTSNADNFVTIGLDQNNSSAPTAITSRGHGIEQYTLFHHPPAQSEVNGVIRDPVQNAVDAIQELLRKFNSYPIGPSSTADDRIAEAGRGPLRFCQYQPSDPKYFWDCANCCRSAETVNIVAGVTPVFAGSAHGRLVQPASLRNAPATGSARRADRWQATDRTGQGETGRAAPLCHPPARYRRCADRFGNHSTVCE
jgi:hypothetical protein